MKRIKMKSMILIVLSLFLVGCASNTDESAYDEAIESGLNYFATEEYGRAGGSFERALEVKPDDNFAQALIEQTSSYIEALDFYDAEKYDDAITAAEVVAQNSSGSAAISKTARELIEKIEKSKEVAKESDKEEIFVDVDIEETADEEVQEDAEVEVVEDTPEESEYTYADFKGYYIYSTSSDLSYDNPENMLLTIGDEYTILSEYATSYWLDEIIDWSIEENVLTIDYQYNNDFNGEGDYEYGTTQYIYSEEDGRAKVIVQSGLEFYKYSYEEIIDYGYTPKDFMVEDVGEEL